MQKILTVEAEEDETGEVDEGNGPEKDRPDATNIAAPTEFVRIRVTSVVPQPRDIKPLLHFRISRADRQRVVPPDNLGKN
mmetsp:Transcript_6930/g.10559  ORF Transcript_6930/g.10559 Transcript_6930/m.10559 type:complete len:80 (-) Transcript_6930:41-280(-)